jgi:D-alanine-D-alanine ligase
LSVLVLHEELASDARPDELEALLQVEQVSAALRESGFRVSVLATGLNLETTLSAIRQRNPDCVFNLVESLAGDGRMIHFLPALLHTVGVPYTGCSSDAFYLSSQKLLAKRWMRLHGIATPAFFAPGTEANVDAERWIVKSVWEHASLGLDDGCVVDNVDAACQRMAESTRQYRGEWFAEEYIDGREFNISVLERDGQPLLLPMAEMTFVNYPRDKPRIVGYAAKWDENAPEYCNSCREFPDMSADFLHSDITKVVHQCWNAFGLRGYARVDFRVDATGKPWVLEINANPSIAMVAGFAAAALQGGISYHQLIEKIVRASLPLDSKGGKLC